jgi:hypothetical protein
MGDVRPADGVSVKAVLENVEGRVDGADRIVGADDPP